MKKSEKVFQSRISVLLLGIMLAPFIVVPIVAMTTPMNRNETIPVLLILLIVSAPLVFAIVLMYRTFYTIEGSKLHVNVWMIPFESIEISDIISVERSYNPLSSPASSLRRLRLNLRKKRMFPFALVSPVREEEFIAELKAANSNIEVRVPPPTKGWWRIQDWDI